MGATYRISTGNNPGTRHVTPHTEPVLLHSGNRNARASTQPYETKNIFQRALLRITGWLKSRLMVGRIDRALEPFIRKAVERDAGKPSAGQCEALNAAIECTFTPETGSEDAVREALGRHIEKMGRKERAALRSEITEFKPVRELHSFSEHVWECLYVPVNDALAQSISRDADYYALEALRALKQTAELRNFERNLDFANIKLMCAFLSAHLDVITPDKHSVDASHSSLTRTAQMARISPTDQMAYMSSTANPAMMKWYSDQPKWLQDRILIVIDEIANKQFPDGLSSADQEQRLHAFALRMQKLLPAAKLVEIPALLNRQPRQFQLR